MQQPTGLIFSVPSGVGYKFYIASAVPLTIDNQSNVFFNGATTPKICIGGTSTGDNLQINSNTVNCSCKINANSGDASLYMFSGTTGRFQIKVNSGGVVTVYSNTANSTGIQMKFMVSNSITCLTMNSNGDATFSGNVQTTTGNIIAGGALSGSSVATTGNITTTGGTISGVGLTLSGDITSSVAASGTFNIKTTNTSNINIISGLNTAIAINTSGIVTTIKGWTNTSDNILKDNQEIAQLNELEDILNNVNVKTYTRNDKDNEYEIGFVAQELEAVLTEKYQGLVKDVNVDVGFGEKTYKSIDYSRMTCILWGIVKNQQQRIQTLEDIIISIDEKISKM
jgi:hypothetical protein